MEEIFKDIPGYEGKYQVSNLGNVMSLNYHHSNNPKILRPRITPNGYYLVTIYGLHEKKAKCYRVHQLVAIAFLNHKPCGSDLVINHIDHNKLNNCLDNLEITTTRQNSSHRRKTGSSKYTGVCWCSSNKKYIVQILVNGKHKNLGYFKDEDEAGKAYNDALLELTT